MRFEMGIENKVEGRKQKRSEIKRLMVYDNLRRKHTIRTGSNL